MKPQVLDNMEEESIWDLPEFQGTEDTQWEDSLLEEDTSLENEYYNEEEEEYDFFSDIDHERFDETYLPIAQSKDIFMKLSSI